MQAYVIKIGKQMIEELRRGRIPEHRCESVEQAKQLEIYLNTAASLREDGDDLQRMYRVRRRQNHLTFRVK
jgi:hypothetical protein